GRKGRDLVLLEARRVRILRVEPGDLQRDHGRAGGHGALGVVAVRGVGGVDCSSHQYLRSIGSYRVWTTGFHSSRISASRSCPFSLYAIVCFRDSAPWRSGYSSRECPPRDSFRLRAPTTVTSASSRRKPSSTASRSSVLNRLPLSDTVTWL